MALKPCKECKKQVSTKAKNCPNCGAETSKATDSKQGCGCFMVLIGIGVSCFFPIVGIPIVLVAAAYAVMNTRLK